MLVIKGSFTVAIETAPAGFVNDIEYIFPAETAIWTTPIWVEADKKYSLGLVSVDIGGTLVKLSNPTLGSIGKAGNFQPITVDY